MTELLLVEKLTVVLGDRSYPIFIGSDLLASNLVADHLRSSQALIVTNTTVSPLYIEPVRTALEAGGIKVSVAELPDGEEHKNLPTLNLIFDQLLQERHHRSTTVVALGGGVVGDMAGFAAACYQRGCGFVQVPTTLLAQVDSSVGGKTGVNHALGKNMIGAFYQPAAVIIDVTTLETLPDRELSAGLAEVIKYGLIADIEFFGWLEENIDNLLDRNADALGYAIKKSCATKAAVVAEDETEQGRRAILNLGHTFGHAIENALGYGSWLHGEAVGAGMAMALDLSCRMGSISDSERRRGTELIERAKLPTQIPNRMTPEVFINLMGMDKKVKDGKIRLVLLESFGHAINTSDFPRELLDETLNAFCHTPK